MIPLTTMPKATAAELLEFLAEKESFQTVEGLLEKEITAVEIKALLRELAGILAQEAEDHKQSRRIDVETIEHIGSNTKKVLASLSPEEERVLLSAFGLGEEEEQS